MIIRFACRIVAIVTGSTVTHDALMIEGSRDEACRVMTGTTIRIRRNMITRFTCGKCTIVTGLAVIHDSSMIKSCGSESCRYMTFAAIISGWYVVATLTCGGRTIMAGSTIVCDTLMIKLRTGKRRSVMTHGAIFIRGKMIIRFNGPGGIITGVTRYTIIDNALVVEHCCCEGARHVAYTAIFVGWNMPLILASRCITMAGVATGI